jgi:pimeloyl-ACP methyl ester carboxylesterase
MAGGDDVGVRAAIAAVLGGRPGEFASRVMPKVGTVGLSTYSADPSSVGSIQVPVLLVIGELTDPRRRELFEGLLGACSARARRVFKAARLSVLPGQRHAAHQTAPHLLAVALRDVLLEA